MTPYDMSTTENGWGFARWLAVTVCLGGLVCAGFVLLVDPYGLYNIFNRAGINAVKPQPKRHINEIKLTQAHRLNPNAVILGNSRAEIGFDPESPALAKRGYSTYNLAIQGSSITNARMQMEYLRRENHRLKLVLLGIDFINFIGASRLSATVPTTPESKASFGIDRWFWRFDSLFSMASVKDSAKTLFIQSNNETETITARGFNPLKQYRRLVRQEGYFALFQQRANENTKTFLAKAQGGLDDASFAELRRILALATDLGSEAVIVVYPYHAQILALFEQTGLWPAFEEWKQRVLAEIDTARRLYPNLRVHLWDFSGYGPYQCEKIPAKGDLSHATEWYWEAGHFKSGLGDIVLEQALSETSGTSVRPDFGMLLDKTSSELNRRRIAEERAACANAYPQLFSDAVAMVLASRRK